MSKWRREYVLTRGWYFLDLLREDAELPIAQILTSSEEGKVNSYRLPALEQTKYLLRVEQKIHFSTPSGESLMHVRPLGLLNFLSLLWLRVIDHKGCLKVDGEFRIRPLLAANGPEGELLKRSISLLQKFGFSVSSDNFQRTPLLFDHGLRSNATALSKYKRGNKPSFAIALHLHYLELWDEIEFFLAKISGPFHLIMTTSHADPDFNSRVRRKFSDAEIIVVENRGRDVGAFIEVLNQGRYDEFDYICKIHGKMSGRSGPRALLGHVWRRANFIDLIGSDEQVQRILDIFKSASRVGMVGSEKFHFPTEYFHGEGLWGENKSKVMELAAKLHGDDRAFEPEYFAGTMFWIARPAIEQIRKLGLRMEDFPVESGKVDGELGHALERVFGLCVTSAGMNIVGVHSPFEKAERQAL